MPVSVEKEKLILISGREEAFPAGLPDSLVREGFRVSFIDNEQAVSACLSDSEVQLICIDDTYVSAENIIPVINRHKTGQSAFSCISLTSAAGRESAGKFLGNGIDFLLVKPFTAGEFMYIVQCCLEKQQLETALKQAEEKIRKLEMALQYSRRLASLGELAVSIAHEIRQPLQVIKVISDSTVYWYQENREAAVNREQDIQDMTKVSRAAHNIEKIIQTIRQMVKKSRHEENFYMDVNRCITDIIKFYNQRLKCHGVRLELFLDKNLQALDFSELQFQQILTNLLNNALHALDSTSGKDKIIRLTTKELGNAVNLIIEDNGPGISAGSRDKIFEPLFTTSSHSDSMGMGLFIVRNILAARQAQITVSDNEMHGTTFTLLFPRDCNGKHWHDRD